MKITKGKLKQIIREELLKELMGPTHLQIDRAQQSDASLAKAAKSIVQFLDPTALTTVADSEYHADLKAAHDAATDPGTTSPATVGLLLLTLAAGVPVAGKLMKIPARVARNALRKGGKEAADLGSKALKNAAKNSDEVIKAVAKASQSSGTVTLNTPRIVNFISKWTISPKVHDIMARAALKLLGSGPSTAAATLLSAFVIGNLSWWGWKQKTLVTGGLKDLGLLDGSSNELLNIVEKVLSENQGASAEDQTKALVEAMTKRMEEQDEDEAAEEFAEAYKIMRRLNKKIKEAK
jgi:hypothetical protein